MNFPTQHILSKAKFGFGLMLAATTAAISPAYAAGDLLIAPTRVVLEGQRGTEIILNNISNDTETYRISLELRRMTADGKLDEVSEAESNALEKAAIEMIRYAPRRVTLPPNQPQAIRIGVSPPQGLADGEYRAHMLFRAIPKAQSVTDQATPSEGVNIALTPIYGVTIPIIIRQGNLQATAAIANGRVEQDQGSAAFAFDLSRSGNRSTYGEIRVTKAGISEPLLVARGIAVYPELNQRKVALAISPEVAAQLKGPSQLNIMNPSSAAAD